MHDKKASAQNETELDYVIQKNWNIHIAMEFGMLIKNVVKETQRNEQNYLEKIRKLR